MTGEIPALAADPELLVPEVAAQLALCEETIRRMIHRGELRAALVGRRFRIRQSWVNTYRQNTLINA